MCVCFGIGGGECGCGAGYPIFCYELNMIKKYKFKIKNEKIAQSERNNGEVGKCATMIFFAFELLMLRCQNYFPHILHRN